MQLNKIEKEVLKKMFPLGISTEIDKLNKQIKKIVVIKREFTGVGFFTEIEVLENKNYELEYKGKLIFGDIGLSVNDNIIMGFLFYIFKGYLVQIEGYSYGDYEINSFDDIPKNYKIIYLKEKRDFPIELLKEK